MKLTALVALLGLTEAAKLRTKTAASIKGTTKAKAKEVGGLVNWRSPSEIMRTFDVDANGTVWQGKEFKVMMANICGKLEGVPNDCYDEGVEHFLGMRASGESGDAKDGVQLEEVIEWINERREEHIKEILLHAEEALGDAGAEMMTKETEMAAMQVAHTQWMIDWNKNHEDFWRGVAQHVSEEICMDHGCVEKCMQHFEVGLQQGLTENGVDEHEIRNFMHTCEAIAERPDKKPFQLICEKHIHGMTWDQFNQAAANAGGKIPTSNQLKRWIQHEREGLAMKAGDYWVGTIDDDGQPNYIQLGNRPWWPGMDHNEQGWGRPWQHDGTCGDMCSILCYVPN